MTYTRLEPRHIYPATQHGSWFDVQLDEGFPCAGRGRTRIYYDEQMQDWWFACQEGRHYLSEQLEQDAAGEMFFVGVYLDD